MRGVHVKNQLNSLLKSHFSRPLKNAKIDFSGTSPGFWVKTKLHRIHPPTHPKLLKTSLISILGPKSTSKHAKTAKLKTSVISTLEGHIYSQTHLWATGPLGGQWGKILSWTVLAGLLRLLWPETALKPLRWGFDWFLGRNLGASKNSWFWALLRKSRFFGFSRVVKNGFCKECLAEFLQAR